MLEFEIYEKNNLIKEVRVDDKKAYIIHHKIGILYPFSDAKEVDKNVISNFFKSRVFEESRPDKDELLSFLGLDYYNPLKIIEKTHGIIEGDYLWVKFKGESLTYNDVKLH